MLRSVCTAKYPSRILDLVPLWAHSYNKWFRKATSARGIIIFTDNRMHPHKLLFSWSAISYRYTFSEGPLFHLHSEHPFSKKLRWRPNQFNTDTRLYTSSFWNTPNDLWTWLNSFKKIKKLNWFYCITAGHKPANIINVKLSTGVFKYCLVAESRF